MMITHKFYDNMVLIKYCDDADTVAHYVSVPAVDGWEDAIEANRQKAMEALGL